MKKRPVSDLTMYGDSKSGFVMKRTDPEDTYTLSIVGPELQRERGHALRVLCELPWYRRAWLMLTAPFRYIFFGDFYL